MNKLKAANKVERQRCIMEIANLPSAPSVSDEPVFDAVGAVGRAELVTSSSTIPESGAPSSACFSGATGFAALADAFDVPELEPSAGVPAITPTSDRSCCVSENHSSQALYTSCVSSTVDVQPLRVPARVGVVHSGKHCEEQKVSFVHTKVAVQSIGSAFPTIIKIVTPRSLRPGTMQFSSAQVGRVNALVRPPLRARSRAASATTEELYLIATLLSSILVGRTVNWQLSWCWSVAWTKDKDIVLPQFKGTISVVKGAVKTCG